MMEALKNAFGRRGSPVPTPLTVALAFGLSLASFTQPQSAFAAVHIDPNEDIRIGTHTVKGQQLLDLMAPPETQWGLEQFDEDQTFYHWTTPQNGIKWSRRGKMNESEVRAYNTPSSEKQSYGPGVYLAESATSSESFGTFPVIFKIQKGTWIYDPDKVNSRLGWSLTDNEKAELGARIPFVQKISGDWWLTHHPDTVQNVQYANGMGGAFFKDLRPALDLLDPLKKLHALQEIDLPFQDPEDPRSSVSSKIHLQDPYLQNLFKLFSYQDPKKSIRDIQRKPEAPWEASDAEGFRRYASFLDDLILRPKSLRSEFGEPDGEQWEKRQLEVGLPYLWEKLTGHSKQDSPYRDQALRFGEIRVTPVQMRELETNPYLQVESRPTEDQMGFWVSYSHPSVETYGRFEHLLSTQLQEDIRNASGASEKDSSQLNQRIIHELLAQLFTRLRTDSISSEEFIRNFISIYPLRTAERDLNLLVARSYSDVVFALQTGNQQFTPIRVSPAGSSDFSLLTPLYIQEKLNKKYSTKMAQFEEAAVDKMIESRLFNRFPDYLPKEEVEELSRVLDRSPSDPSQEMGWDIDRISSLEAVSNYAKKRGLTSYIQKLSDSKLSVMSRVIMNSGLSRTGLDSMRPSEQQEVDRALQESSAKLDGSYFKLLMVSGRNSEDFGRSQAEPKGSVQKTAFQAWLKGELLSTPRTSAQGREARTELLSWAARNPNPHLQQFVQEVLETPEMESFRQEYIDFAYVSRDPMNILFALKSMANRQDSFSLKSLTAWVYSSDKLCLLKLGPDNPNSFCKDAILNTALTTAQGWIESGQVDLGSHFGPHLDLLAGLALHPGIYAAGVRGEIRRVLSAYSQGQGSKRLWKLVGKAFSPAADPEIQLDLVAFLKSRRADDWKANQVLSGAFDFSLSLTKLSEKEVNDKVRHRLNALKVIEKRRDALALNWLLVALTDSGVFEPGRFGYGKGDNSWVLSVFPELLNDFESKLSEPVPLNFFFIVAMLEISEKIRQDEQTLTAQVTRDRLQVESLQGSPNSQEFQKAVRELKISEGYLNLKETIYRIIQKIVSSSDEISLSDSGMSYAENQYLTFYLILGQSSGRTQELTIATLRRARLQNETIATLLSPLFSPAAFGANSQVMDQRMGALKVIEGEEDPQALKWLIIALRQVSDPKGAWGTQVLHNVSVLLRNPNLSHSKTNSAEPDPLVLELWEELATKPALEPSDQFLNQIREFFDRHSASAAGSTHETAKVLARAFAMKLLVGGHPKVQPYAAKFLNLSLPLDSRTIQSMEETLRRLNLQRTLDPGSQNCTIL